MPRYLSGWDIEVRGVSHVLRERDVLWNNALREYAETELHGNGRLFASGIQVKIEIDFRTGFDQTSAVRWKDVSVFSQRVFIEEETNRIIFRIFYKVCCEVVDDFITLRVGRFAFDRCDVHVFGETRIDEDVHDIVWGVCRQNVRLLYRDDVVGLSNVPLIEVLE